MADNIDKGLPNITPEPIARTLESRDLASILILTFLSIL